MAESHCRLATLYSSFHCLEKRQSWSNNDATRLWRPAMDGLPLVIRTEAGWECGGMSPHACKVIRSEGPPLFLKVFVFVQFFSFFFSSLLNPFPFFSSLFNSFPCFSSLCSMLFSFLAVLSRRWNQCLEGVDVSHARKCCFSDNVHPPPPPPSSSKMFFCSSLDFGCLIV